MKQTPLWVAAIIIASAIILGFAFSVPHTRDIADASVKQNVQSSISAVSLHDSFKKGLHTITGSIEAPNACASVTAQAIFKNEASSTGRIFVEISLSRDSGVCLQVPTRENFTASVSAPANIPITATVNGVAAATTML